MLQQFYFSLLVFYTMIFQPDSSDSNNQVKTRKKKVKHDHGYSATNAENEERATNRLVTRALYDTEEEVSGRRGTGCGGRGLVGWG